MRAKPSSERQHSVSRTLWIWSSLYLEHCVSGTLCIENPLYLEHCIWNSLYPELSVSRTLSMSNSLYLELLCLEHCVSRKRHVWNSQYLEHCIWNSLCLELFVSRTLCIWNSLHREHCVSGTLWIPLGGVDKELTENVSQILFFLSRSFSKWTLCDGRFAQWPRAADNRKHLQERHMTDGIMLTLASW